MFKASVLLHCKKFLHIPSQGMLPTENCLRLGAQTSYGSWGSLDKCDPGTFAASLRLIAESDQGGGDDTALNGINLYCKDSVGL